MKGYFISPLFNQEKPILQWRPDTVVLIIYWHDADMTVMLLKRQGEMYVSSNKQKIF